MSYFAKGAELEFLRELDAWIALGRQAYLFAQEKGLPPSAITYRLKSFGLRAVRASGLVSISSGRRLEDAIAAGEIRLRDPEPATSAA